MIDQDIKILIIKEVSNDINNLINIITIDKSTYNLFSRKHYWDLIFTKHDLPLSNIVYDDVSQWLVVFKTEIKLKIYTDRLMNILENPKIEDFDKVYELDYYSGLVIYYQDISFIHVLDVEGINMKIISTICNKCRLNKLDKTIEEVGFATCLMKFEDEKYFISVYNPSLYVNKVKSDLYENYITRNNMKQILYNILSYGVIPIDEYIGNPVKLII
jgi:hypothetical protein